MKDVHWSDIIGAILLAAVLVIALAGLVYAVLYIILDVERTVAAWLMEAALIAIPLAEGLVFARLYVRMGETIEYVWAWPAVAAVATAALLVAYAAGAVTQESAFYLTLSVYRQLAFLFLVVMLSLFLYARRTTPLTGQRVDPWADRKMLFLRR